jgi:AraC-like DNA-binding protein
MAPENPSAVLDPALAGTDQSLSSSYLATVLPALAAHYELDPCELLTSAGLASDLLEQNEQFVPLVDVMRLFVTLMERTGDPGLGFETGKHVRPRAYQVLGYAILSSGTLGEAIDRLTRFEKLVGNLGRTDWHHQGESVALHWQCPINGPPRRFVVEAAVTGWVTFARQLVDEDPPSPDHVCFTHGPPSETQRYEDWFQCPVHFRADFDGVVFPAHLLDHPLAGADPGLNELMEREARQLLADYDIKANLINAVRRQIYRRLAGGEPAMEDVAAELGVSARTLQHRLRQQGVTFQEVLDGLRRSLAELYLRDEALSLTEIALLLGFAEQSSFTRAFRRWRGMSPAAWRRSPQSG